MRQRKPPNPTQLKFMPTKLLGTGFGFRTERTEKKPRIHMGKNGRGECDPHRMLDGKTEGWGYDWNDVTCPKCQALLRVQQPNGSRNWRKFVGKCSARGLAEVNIKYSRMVGAGTLLAVAVHPDIPRPGIIGKNPLDIEIDEPDRTLEITQDAGK